MRPHLPTLEIQQDGTVLVETQDDLDRLLACPIRDLSTEMIDFEDRQWLERGEQERVTNAIFLNSARQRVCTEGRLPAPHEELPPIGTRVEALHGGKPNPDRRWALGTTTSHEWISVTMDWRVGVTFDHSNGAWCGQPIRGATTTPRFIYVVGDPTRRPFSSMCPSEIEAMFETRRR